MDDPTDNQAGGQTGGDWAKPLLDLGRTLIYWCYFIAAFLCFFDLFYALAFLFSRDLQRAFQRINHRFYRGFFGLVTAITPQVRFEIDPEVRNIRGAVVVSNHVSYLDPILLVSLYPRQKTIVKHTFFRAPVFGTLLRISGYLPSESSGRLADLMISQMESMPDFLAGGGNLFIFPEGTRSRAGAVNPFHKGAFKIAKRCEAPLHVIRIRHTDRFFPPGRFRFRTCGDITVTVEPAGIIPAEIVAGAAVADLMERARAMLAEEKHPLP